MRNLARWAISAGFIAIGLYCLSGAFQNADSSVYATGQAMELHKAIATLLLPIAVLFGAVGVLFSLAIGNHSSTR